MKVEYPPCYHRTVAYLVAFGGHGPRNAEARRDCAKTIRWLRANRDPETVRREVGGLRFISGQFPVKETADKPESLPMKMSYTMTACFGGLFCAPDGSLDAPYICTAAVRLLGVVGEHAHGTRFRVTISDRPNGGHSVVFDADTNLFRVKGHSFAGGCALCELATALKLGTFYVRIKRLD